VFLRPIYHSLFLFFSFFFSLECVAEEDDDEDDDEYDDEFPYTLSTSDEGNPIYEKVGPWFDNPDSHSINQLAQRQQNRSK
jgi:hypothetical protein